MASASVSQPPAAAADPERVLKQADLLRTTARYPEAEILYRRALAMRQSELQPSPQRIASALYGLALLDRDTGRFAEAERLGKRAMADGVDTALALNLLGTVIRSEGRLEEARTLLSQALNLVEASPRADSATLAGVLINLGNVDRLKGDLPSARQHFARSVELLKNTGAGSALLPTALNGLSETARASGDLKLARSFSMQALSFLRQSVGTDHPDYATALATLAAIYVDLHNNRKARELYRNVLSIDERSFGTAHPRVGTDLNNIAVTSAQLHDYASAEFYFRRALAGPVNTVPSAFWRANLAELCVRQSRRDEALHLYREATSILGQASSPTLRYAEILEEYAVLLRGAGSYAEAEEAETRAMRIRVRHAIENPTGAARSKSG